MKGYIRKIQQAQLSMLVAASMPCSRELATAARIGGVIGATMASGAVMAQGFIQGIANLNSLGQAIIALLIVVGMLAGLAMILGGLWAAYKKHNERGSDDITWGKIGAQVFVGGAAMALSWLGVSVVTTLGGSSTDIGRAIK